MPKAKVAKKKRVTKKTKKEAIKVAPETKPAKKGKKILIIEDERPLSHALELKLGNSGFETKVISTGTEGIKEVLDPKYDLILLDIILPGVDGFAIMEECKKKKIKTPIIVLSNLGQEEDKERAKKLGVIDYCVKVQMPLSQIVSRIKSALK